MIRTSRALSHGSHSNYGFSGTSVGILKILGAGDAPEIPPGLCRLRPQSCQCQKLLRSARFAGNASMAPRRSRLRLIERTGPGVAGSHRERFAVPPHSDATRSGRIGQFGRQVGHLLEEGFAELSSNECTRWSVGAKLLPAAECSLTAPRPGPIGDLLTFTVSDTV